ncbi:MAG: hypothetical protein IPG93_21485 [Burkholderiales bacterium]|nr:hypothetical protein [Burkholderiales bacterium]
MADKNVDSFHISPIEFAITASSNLMIYYRTEMLKMSSGITFAYLKNTVLCLDSINSGGPMTRFTPAIVLAIAAAPSAYPAMAWAQQGSTPLQKGEIIHLDVDYILTKSTAAGQAGDSICFKRGSKFEVVRGSSDVTVLQRRNRWWVGRESNESLSKSCDDPSVDIKLPDEDSTLYSVDTNKLPRDYYRHFGITHGALFVPFKRRSDKSLSGESNLGYYLGYRFGGPWGVAITPAASVGMSLVNVSDDSATTATSVKDSGTRAAFTWATGFILTHLEAFQVGIFVGRDRIGGDAGANWKYEGKVWTSIAIGYAFTK